MFHVSTALVNRGVYTTVVSAIKRLCIYYEMIHLVGKPENHRLELAIVLYSVSLIFVYLYILGVFIHSLPLPSKTVKQISHFEIDIILLHLGFLPRISVKV